MPITFNCQSCKAKMTVPDAMAGKRGKCSKCKAAVLVPGANGAPAEPKSEPVRAAAAPPRPALEPKVESIRPSPPPVAPAPPEIEEDAESAAAAALADEPKKAEAEESDFISFNCPQCDEPVKLELEHAGKKHPCPSCRRIIAVPRPAKKDPTTWRDKGPSLPSGARREVGPAPEDAWGRGDVKGVSAEALKEAGALQEKRKPLTLLQRARPFLLFGVPLLLLIGGAVWGWNWLTRTSEEGAYRAAMEVARGQGISEDGRAALYAYSGEYQLHAGQEKKAREDFGQARVLADRSRNPERDGLLLDLLPMQLRLNDVQGGTEKDKKARAGEVQKLLDSTLRSLSPDVRLEGLRRAAALLAEYREASRVNELTRAVYPAPLPDSKDAAAKADHYEALAAAALELFRASATAEVEEIAEPVRKAYADKKDRPLLRPAVVALAVARGQEPPEPGSSIDDRDAIAIGRPAGLARKAGGAAEARQAAAGISSSGVQARALLEIADATGEAADVDAAIKALPQMDRRYKAWAALRLIELGRRAKMDVEGLSAAVGQTPVELKPWAHLLVLRAKLAASKSVEEPKVLEAFGETQSLGARVAHLELARHNTRQSRGWASKIKTWEEGPRAFGSLGVALGMQGK